MGGSFARQFGQEHPSILVGTDWQGMSRDDLATVGNSLQNVSDFPMVAERLIQGMVNQWVLTRSFQGTCRELPDLLNEGEPVIASP